ncbi:MAG: hypothetical protein NWF00_10915 [Candidatus Bathyarchaeota archaeon]|nr:hypothetical protein [Candidatus Bathyarchaeota archaeon]
MIEYCVCPHCKKELELVVESDMRYGIHVSARKVTAKLVHCQRTIIGGKQNELP